MERGPYSGISNPRIRAGFKNLPATSWPAPNGKKCNSVAANYQPVNKNRSQKKKGGEMKFRLFKKKLQEYVYLLLGGEGEGGGEKEGKSKPHQ